MNLKKLKTDFVRVKDASEMLGVCSNTVRSWGAAGKIEEYRHPVNNYRLYKLKDIEQLLKKAQKPTRKPR